jgi:hypothetical protein
MRRPVQIALIALVVVLAAATSYFFVQYRQRTVEYTDMRAKEEAAATRYSQTIDAIAEIQDSLNAISVGDAKLQPEGLKSEQDLSGPRSQQALDRIALLRASILRNRDRIQQLENNLRHSGLRVAGLQRMIAQLKETATEKESMIAMLTTRVDSLTVENTGLATRVQETQDTLAVRDLTLEERRRELATVYYIVGNKKQLEGAGVLVAKGGVLGMGKTLTPAGKPDPSLFIPLDTDQANYVNTNAAKAKVITPQPHDSYEMIMQNGQVVLHILDPVEFRKIRQLVIVTSA